MCEGIRKLQEESAREAAKEATAKTEAAKDAEAIKNSYQLMEKVAPELDKKSKIELIAKQFKKTIRYVNSVLA